MKGFRGGRLGHGQAGDAEAAERGRHDGVPVNGLVLAGGASRRAGGVKALAELDGRPLVVCAVETLLAGGCARVGVVLAAPHAAAIEAALPAHLGVIAIHNPAPEQGMLASLAWGVRAMGHGARALVVSLVDHPHVLASTVAALVHGFDGAGAQWLRPVLGGRRGHPMLIGRAVFDAILAADPRAVTTRDVLGLATAMDVEVADPAIFEDLDTAAQLRSLGARPFV